VIFVDLGLRLLEGGGGSEGFGYRLAIDGARETKFRTPDIPPKGLGNSTYLRT
jgi:hypothetical protein